MLRSSAEETDQPGAGPGSSAPEARPSDRHLSTVIQLMEHPSSEGDPARGQRCPECRYQRGRRSDQPLNEVRADLCILGTNSIDAEEGITDSDWEVIQVKKR